MSIRTYSELITLPTLEDRYNYLKIGDSYVGEDTFGWDRYLNQQFYTSRQWRDFRHKIIVRDNGCEMALDGWEIKGKIIIHHLNPIRKEDILYSVEDVLLNPENIVCVSHSMHNAIHFGDISLLPQDPIERRPNDTCPWRR